MAQTLEPFVCGGLSAMLGSTVIHPIDLIKVRQQVSTTGKGSPMSLAVGIVKTEGPRGLYKGLSASLFRQSTYGTARIGFHRSFSDFLVKRNEGKPIPVWQKAASGMASGALAVCIGSPFDVALVRMQNDGALPREAQRNYRNVIDALVRIAREEGVVKLWRGLIPNVARGMAMNTGMMASYDQAKQVASEWTKRDINSLHTSLIASAIAGFMCAFLSQPFDLLKSRLMTQRPDAVTKQLPYSGLFDCARKTYVNEGALAFFKGFPAYYARCAPHSMIILMSNESITRAYRHLFGLAKDREHDLVTAVRFHSAGAVVDLHRHSSTALDADEYDAESAFGDTGDE